MRPYRGFFSICLSLVDVQPIRLTVQSTDSLPARPSRLSSVRRMHALLWSAMFMVAVSVSAQVPAPTIPDNGLTPASPLGIPPHASTQGTNEKVSLMNGALNLFIPLLSLPQRGGYPLSLGYVNHSNLYSLLQITSIQSSNNEQGGHNQLIDTINYYDSLATNDYPLEINLPRLQFSIEYMGDYTWMVGTLFNYVNVFCATNFVFTDWDGNKHPFENVTECNTQYAGNIIANFQSRKLTDSSDGSFYRLDTSNATDMKVFAKDGTIYHFYQNSDVCTTGSDPGGCSSNNQENYYDARSPLIVDPNGNQISIQSSGNPPAQPNYTVTDTLGRQIEITQNGISYKDSNGTQQQITVTTTPSSQTTTVATPLACHYSGPFQPAPYVTPKVYAFDSIAGIPASTTITIAFPGSAGGGAKTYTLLLDPLSRVSKIQYPTGGYTRYDYIDSGHSVYPTPTNVQCTQTLSEVAHKYECSNSNGSCSTEQVTTYEPAVTTSGDGMPYNASITVTNPLGEKEVHNFSTVSRVRTNPQETDVYLYNSSGSLLRTTHNDFFSIAPPGVGQYSYDITFPSKVTTTLNDISPAISSSTSYSYPIVTAEPYGNTVLIDNPTEIDTTGYGGTMQRLVSQAWEPATAFTSSIHILDRLQSRTVTDPISGQSNTTTNGYDTSGNVTSVTVSGTQLGSYTTQYNRNSNGEIIKIIDPKNNPTNISYADAWSDPGQSCVTANSSAYPTTVTNALGQTRSYIYNACTGTIASQADANSVTTSYTYDALNRVLCSTTKDSSGVLAGHACDSYNDSFPSSSTNVIEQDSAHNITGQSFFDGYGRLQQTRLTSDPSGTDYTDTTYDSLGRVASVSNPYRSSPSPTDGISQYTYDALGRLETLTHPDNSILRWSYSGNIATSIDEVGNTWKRTSDALGRLTNVTEPGGLQTAYTYDAFNDLLSVTQTGASGEAPRTRNFTFDTLSRLRSATNPESGTIGYSYDANGNLQTKTDARGVTTTFAYDGLNRLLSKTYQNAPAGSLSSCFQYDSSPGGIGRLAAEWTQNGSCPASAPTTGYQTMKQILAYDPMGRVLQEQQCHLHNCQTGTTPYTIGTGFDLVGNQTSYTNGIHSIGLINSYDAAGHLKDVGSSLFDGMNPASLLSIGAYTPAGAIQSMTLGSELNVTKTYDNRLRPSGETAAPIKN